MHFREDISDDQNHFETEADKRLKNPKLQWIQDVVAVIFSDIYGNQMNGEILLKINYYNKLRDMK